MTDADLDHMQSVMDNLPPPWEIDGPHSHNGMFSVRTEYRDGFCMFVVVNVPKDLANFVAAIPALIAEVRRLRAERHCTLFCVGYDRKDDRPLDSLVSEALAQKDNEIARLREVLVNLLVPIEAFWADAPSRGYLAPALLAALETAILEAREVLEGKP